MPNDLDMDANQIQGPGHVNLNAVPPFDPDSDQGTLSKRWTRWLLKLENFFLAANIAGRQADTRKRALLLHFAGDRVHDIFLTLDQPAEDYEGAKTQLSAHFDPPKNTAIEAVNFRNCHQRPDETLDQWHVRLIELAKHCDFNDIDKEITLQIICHCNSTRLRNRILELKTDEQTLKNIKDIAKRMECASRNTKILKGETASAEPAAARHVQGPHNGSKPRGKPRGNQSNQGYQHSRSQSQAQQKPQQQGKPQSSTCGLCGGNYPHEGGPTQCPAYGKTCYSCQGLNHYGSVCRKNPSYQ